LFESSDGTIWTSVLGEPVELIEEPGQSARLIRRHTSEEGLTHHYLSSFAEDSRGSLWMSTESAGAIRLSRGGFSSYTEHEGLEKTRVGEIFSTRSGRLCATASDTLFCLLENSFVATRPNIPKDVGPGWGWLQTTVEDHVGDWWVPTDHGLY